MSRRGERRRVWGVKKTILMICAVVLVGCGTTPEPTNTTPEKLIANPIVEEAIRFELNKPKGELTKADLEKVTFLNLFNTKITDVGLKEVAKMQQLEGLGLGYTQITDAGLKEVAKCTQLTNLDLEATQITDVGLKEVAKLEQLEWLGLSHCKQITKSGVAELKKVLPKCKIRRP